MPNKCAWAGVQGPGARPRRHVGAAHRNSCSQARLGALQLLLQLRCGLLRLRLLRLRFLHLLLQLYTRLACFLHALRSSVNSCVSSTPTTKPS